MHRFVSVSFSFILADPALPPPPMTVPAQHPLLVPHPDNQLSSGAFSRFRQLGTTNIGGTTTLALTHGTGLPGSNNLPTPSIFGQTHGPTATILTGPAAIAAHQQIAQQAQRNRMLLCIHAFVCLQNCLIT